MKRFALILWGGALWAMATSALCWAPDFPGHELRSAFIAFGGLIFGAAAICIGTERS